ncbi:polymorphic toxin type 50 domain-containing protein [Kroppenstedtia sanguinis]|uniref:Polymorphic toxin type 50 domain-containing protein n=1 Tax=Kroppenstedtia sanguinis TaxID=1380684 RepID=A0ABW4C9G3_9BACL
MKIHEGKQGKHILGHNNYKHGKSILDENPNKLLDKYAGRGERVAQQKENFDTGDQIIGRWVDPKTNNAYPTTRGTIHYSKNGAHIVPARPRSMLPKK